MLDVVRELSPRVEYYSHRRVLLRGGRRRGAGRTRSWPTSIRDRIWERVRVPVTVGIARTRTLAKLISDTAKPFGALAVLDRPAEEALLAGRPVTEITGHRRPAGSAAGALGHPHLPGPGPGRPPAGPRAADGHRRGPLVGAQRRAGPADPAAAAARTRSCRAAAASASRPTEPAGPLRLAGPQPGAADRGAGVPRGAAPGRLAVWVGYRDGQAGGGPRRPGGPQRPLRRAAGRGPALPAAGLAAAGRGRRGCTCSPSGCRPRGCAQLGPVRPARRAGRGRRPAQARGQRPPRPVRPAQRRHPAPGRRSTATRPTPTTSATSGARCASDLSGHVRRHRPGMERAAHGADRAARAGAARPRARRRAGGPLPATATAAPGCRSGATGSCSRPLGQRPGPEPVPAPHRLDLAGDDPRRGAGAARRRSRWTSRRRSAWSGGVWYPRPPGDPRPARARRARAGRLLHDLRAGQPLLPGHDPQRAGCPC